MKRLVPLVCTALICASAFGQQAATNSALLVADLRCEMRENPLAIDTQAPRFSWKVLPGFPGAGQAAYRIAVASSELLLAKDQPDLWDSGKVASDECLQIPYAGKLLGSGQHAYWRVSLWNKGGAATTSATATFSMGLLQPADWQAKWIAFPNDDGDKRSEPSPCFRKEFAIGKPIVRAMVRVCGLGQYELTLNGAKVGDNVLGEAWTTYSKNCNYDTYDVTTQLQQGGNALGIMLGNGMYNVLKIEDRYTKFSGTFGVPKAILQLEIEYADGTRSTVATDDSWKAARGPVTFSHAYGGEDYDARKEMPGWDSAGFSDGAWSAAAEVVGPGKGQAELVAAVGPPITIHKSYAIAKVTEPRPGIWVYDFGQNLSGWPHLAVRGSAGAMVRMVPGELLSKDGGVSPVVDTKRGLNWYTYTLKGSGVEDWQPRFSSYGFRYLQVTGARPPEGTVIAVTGSGDGRVPLPLPEQGPEAAAQIIDLHSQFVYADVANVGSFESSDETLNRIHALINAAIRSNTQSVLTDCPHREKLGWLEQTHLMADSIAMNEDVSSLYAKMCRDMRDAQLGNGLVPNIAPEYTVFAVKGDDDFRDSPEWGAATVLDPWVLYQYYGDKRTLEQQYETMKKYVAHLGTRAAGNILSHGLGDWFDAPPANHGAAKLTSKALTATATYFQDVDTLRKAAELLHHEEDARRYAELAGQIKAAFNAKFFDAATGQYEKGSQTADAMPLALGLVDADKREVVMGHLVDAIRNNKYMVTSGDVGFTYVVQALTQANRGDVMYAMMAQDAGPGYVYQLNHGATSLTEAWDVGQSSQNHLMIGHGEAWLYRGLAGIQNDAGSVAFGRIVIRPEIVENLGALNGKSFVKAAYDSARGRIESGWVRTGKAVTMNVTIPPTATATIYVPAADPRLVQVSATPADPAMVPKLEASADHFAVFTVGAGTYAFQSTVP